MLSVIIIGKNEGWRLKKCFDSVFSVLKEDAIDEFEVIYVDSRSTDDSVALATTYQQIHIIVITGECNAAIARNIGAKEANGDTLLFVDGDMELQSGFLPAVLDDKKELTYQFVSGIFDDVIYDLQWNYLRTSRRHNLNEGDKDVFQTTTGGLFIITKSLWDGIGGMDNRFKRSQDYDLGLRLSERGIPLCRKSILFAKHYMVEYSAREDYITNLKYTALLFRKHWQNPNYLKIILKNRYTTLALILTLLISWWFWQIVFLWFLLLIYKACHQKTNPFYLFWRLLVGDFYFIAALLFFWPNNPIVSYEKIN